ncbi:MMPL family transporter [Actinomadura sp. HBU206391]|uniref:MMPL family transporter n=1 Tax=Actinomadura sp. HBU206391 TaxID=2731692 RepID=UPI00164F5673|nr:MMPL family transporter [Actinomadura sp. HBU206391]MBC6459975.1 MMPL family transporter [Actinomadura sp. HBU206391]
MLARLSAFVVRRRRPVLAAVVLLAIVGALAGSTLFGKLKGGGFDDPGSESARATAVLEDVLGQGRPDLILLVRAKAGVDDPAAAAAGTALTRRLAAERGVTNVTSYWTAGRLPPLRGDDGRSALVLASVGGDSSAVDRRVETLLPRYEGPRDGLDVRVGGDAMVQRELNAQTKEDVAMGEMIVLPLTLVALVFVFGSVVAALLPLAVALVTMLLGLGLMWVLASATDLSVFAANVVTFIGLGLAIDYSLLIVNRYREEVSSGDAHAEAIGAAMRSAGRTVVFSAVMVAVALSAMAAFPMLALRSMAYAGVVTALLAAVASLVVLPALLAVCGPRIAKTRRPRRSAEDGFWHRLALMVMRRPVPIATAATLLLLLLGAPFLGVRLGYPDERTLPESATSRQVAATLRADFDPGEQNALQVVAPRAGTGQAAVGPYAARLSLLPHVTRVDSAAGGFERGRPVAPIGPEHRRFTAGAATFLSVIPAAGTTEEAADRLVRDLRTEPAPFEVLVGGTAAQNHDSTAALTERLPVALGLVVTVMLVLLFLLTGSVLVPFLALLLSALSLTATFGALVWIFQDGNLSGLLGDFTVTGTTVATVPVMLFALAFGLAMDYQVFLLSRIREEYDRTGSATTAVALGLERIGRIVTAAAVLISIVFLAFLISDVTFMKAFGVGLPLAVLMDATIVRGALLPAMMRLGGRATWWAPEPLRRVHARFGLRENVEEVAREPVTAPA